MPSPVTLYMEETAKLREEYGDRTIMLLEVGTFLESYGVRAKDGTVWGSDIEGLGHICNLLVVPKEKQKYKGGTVLMAGIPASQWDRYHGRLVEAGYTVAKYLQDGPGKNPNRTLSEVVSPGTMLERGGGACTNILMCVWVHRSAPNRLAAGGVVTGVAWLDALTGRTGVFQEQVADRHEPSTYDELERQVSTLQPREAIVITNLDDERDRDIADFVGLQGVKTHFVRPGDSSTQALRARNAQKQTYVHESLSRYFPGKEMQAKFGVGMRETDLAMQALVFLLDFAHRQSAGLAERVAWPTSVEPEERLALANHSLRQLNIIPDQRHSGALSSVSSLLNCAVTAMGSRAFDQELYNPTANAEVLSARYGTTDTLLSTAKSVDRLRDDLRGIGDIERFQRRLCNGAVRPRDVAALAADIAKGGALLKRVSGKRAGRVRLPVSTVPTDNVKQSADHVLDHLTSAFDLALCAPIDEITAERLGGRPLESLAISPRGRCPELDEIHDDALSADRALGYAAEAMGMLLMAAGPAHMSESTSWVKVHSCQKTPPTIRITQVRATLLRKALAPFAGDEVTPAGYLATARGQAVMKAHLGGCIISLSRLLRLEQKGLPVIEGTDDELDLSQIECVRHGAPKSCLIVTSPQLCHLAERRFTAAQRVITRLQVFWKAETKILATKGPQLRLLANFVAAVDLAQTRAYVAHKYNYCRPEPVAGDGSSFVEACDIRHPLIEQLSRRETYVPNDVSLGSADGHKTVLLYGTNAVGKTSLIRALGISVVMAQAGLHVPCSSFRFRPYTRLFTRILGNDNLFKGLSTFAVEMSELANILRYADENSLVLGDELCSGTESSSALSIFTAGLEHLDTRRVSCMFATHMHEIRTYPEIQALRGLRLMHMAVHYDESTGALVYDRKLRDGPGDGTYGLEVCRALKLPSAFLQRAGEIRSKHSPLVGAAPPLDAKASRYNAGKLKGTCERCGERPATDVHHLRHQASAREDNGYIASAGHHKDHEANLMAVCKECHDVFHHSTKEHRRAMRADGSTEIVEC